MLRAVMAMAFFLTAYPLSLPPVFSEETTLLETIDAIEKTDAEIAALTKELKSAKTSAQRRRIQAQIEELQRRQQELLPRLEELVGPLPPSVSKEKPIPLEEQLKTKEQRHETTLDGNIDKR